MSCKFSEVDGTCQLYDPGHENFGWKDKGKCICEDDEDPGNMCEEYEER